MKNSACKQQMFTLKQKQKEGNWDCFVALYKILYYHKNPNFKKKINISERLNEIIGSEYKSNASLRNFYIKSANVLQDEQ